MFSMYPGSRGSLSGRVWGAFSDVSWSLRSQSLKIAIGREKDWRGATGEAGCSASLGFTKRLMEVYIQNRSTFISFTYCTMLPLPACLRFD